MKASQNPLDLAELKQLGLSTDDLYALLEFAVQKRAGDNPQFASALAKKVLQLGRQIRAIRVTRCGHPAGQLQALFQDARNSRLKRKREEQDLTFSITLGYANISGCLQGVPRTSWPTHTETYWIAAGKRGPIPSDIHQRIVTGLARVRSMHQATVVILAACLNIERPALDRRIRRSITTIRSRR